MDYDISQSVSQRGSGEETAENRRIHEVADELRRRSQLYEAQLRDGQGDVNHLEIEQRVAEQYAKIICFMIQLTPYVPLQDLMVEPLCPFYNSDW